MTNDTRSLRGMFQAGIVSGEQLGTQRRAGRRMGVPWGFILAARAVNGPGPIDRRPALDGIFWSARVPHCGACLQSSANG